MKLRHHFWSSVVLGGAISAASHSAVPLAGAMVGGFFVDCDHIVDHVLSIVRRYPYAAQSRILLAKRESRGKVIDTVYRLLLRRKLMRMPLVLHSYEFLTATIVIAVILHTPFLIGLAAGYSLHLLLDFIRHHHEFRSPFFYFLSYRLALAFRRDRLIKAQHA